METREEECTDNTWRKKAIEIFQAALCNNKLAYEATWQGIVMLPKGVGELCGIVLVEVLWNKIATIKENWLGNAVDFHDVLHNFQDNQVTGTSSLEENTLHQLATIKGEVLYKIFLDLHKAYYAMNWEQSL